MIWSFIRFYRYRLEKVGKLLGFPIINVKTIMLLNKVNEEEVEYVCKSRKVFKGKG